MEREEALIHAIKTASSDTGKYNIIAESLESLVKGLKEQQRTIVSSQNEWKERIGNIEYLLKGADGQNGIRSTVKDILKRLSPLEDKAEALKTKTQGLEQALKDMSDIRTLLHKLDMDVARVDTKMKTTWYLLTLVITGLIGVAFSLWGAIGHP